MKRILKYILTAFLLTTVLSQTLEASEVSPETAKINAEKFLDSSVRRKVKGVGPIGGKVNLTLSQTVVDNQARPLYYIFSKGNGNGFVIASADNRFVPILAHSEKGTFESVEKMPDPLKELLKEYDKTLTLIKSGDTKALNMEDTPKRRDEIIPLLEFWWGQDYPLNKKCPVIENELAPVGCVATAMAMIMAYHKYPEQGSGFISYTNPYDKAIISYDFENANFNFSKMQPYYIGDEEEDEIEAAAELCFAAGASVKSEYRPTGTGADLAATPFSTYFNYPSEGLALLSRSYFTPGEWEDLVYDELKNGRPVLYRGGGKVGTGGHAFVIDGYEEETGLFHINWGWYGDADGYYNLNILRPTESGTGSNGDDVYSIDQQIVRGLRTPGDNVPTPIFTAEGVGFDIDSQEYAVTRLYCRGGQNVILPGLEATNSATGEVFILESIDKEPITIRDALNNVNRMSIAFRPDFSNIPDGEYILRPTAKLTDDELLNPGKYADYYPVYCTLINTRYVTVSVEHGMVVNAENGTDVNHDIRFTNFRSSTTLITGSNRAFIMDGENLGNNIIQAVKVWVYKHGSNELAWPTGERCDLVLEPSNSGTFNLAIPNISNMGGTFDLQVKNNEDSTINYSGRIPFELVNSSTGVTKDGFKYVVISEDERTAAAIRTNTTARGEVEFPETVDINGKTYTLIELSNAIMISSTGVTKVTLPSTVRRIAGSSFNGCSSLAEINLPESLEYLGGGCFLGCRALTSINIPKNLKAIGDKTFSSSGLTSVELPEGLTTIGQYGFFGCKLSSVTIPSTIESIGNFAFDNDNINFIICKAVTPPSIEDYTFYSQTYKRASIFVPAESLDRYKAAPGWNKFANFYIINEDKYAKVNDVWYELTPDFEAHIIPSRDSESYHISRLSIPESITYMGMPYKVTEICDYAFNGNKTVTSYSGAVNVRRIGKCAFANSGLTSLSFAGPIEEIADSAFYHTDISSISRLPSVINRIGNYAFSGNRRLNFFKGLDGPDWLSLPLSLNSIGDGAFEDCVSLDKLQINSSINYGQGVFKGCSTLSSIYLSTAEIPLEEVRKLNSSLESTAFYIDSPNRPYFINAFDRPQQLYDLQKVISVDWDGAPNIDGITEVTITFDSKLGNTDVSSVLVIDSWFRNIGSANVTDRRDYEATGTIKVAVAPVTVTEGHVQINFMQPGLAATFDINITGTANLIKTIILSNEEKVMAPGETFLLEASYSPENVENSELVWTSSDLSVAKVDADGTIRAVAPGKATITCKALMGIASAKCTIEVKSVFRPGKALDEDDPEAEITVADLVAIANHITGKTPDNFNIRNADVNQDGNITISDITSTVKIILNTDHSVEMPTDVPVDRSEAADEDNPVILDFDNLEFSGEETHVGTFLATDMDFTALQADIRCPKNVMISNITLDERMKDHMLSWKRLNSGDYRVIIYSLNNALLPNYEPLLRMDMKAIDNPDGKITLSHSYISTSASRKYFVASAGGNIADTLDVGNLYEFQETSVDIYSANGVLIKREADIEKIKESLMPGIYILRGAKEVRKILVK